MMNIDKIMIWKFWNWEHYFSKRDIYNIEKEPDEINLINMIDSKESDERDQIDENEEENLTNDIEVLKLGN